MTSLVIAWFPPYGTQKPRPSPQCRGFFLSAGRGVGSADRRAGAAVIITGLSPSCSIARYVEIVEHARAQGVSPDELYELQVQIVAAMRRHFTPVFTEPVIELLAEELQAEIGLQPAALQ
jgi:hypothetical protein